MATIVQDLDIEARDPTRIAVAVGANASLGVPNMASAGYLWEVRADMGSLAVERRIEGDEPESVSFAIKPLVPGEHHLALVLRRPWEDAPRRTLDVVVRAHRPHLFD